jgi:hypothetical protein
VKVFGKTVSEYFVFQRWVMILIVVVGLARLFLTLSGVSDSVTRWFSVTAVAVVGIVYCAIQVPLTGFGGRKHLIPLFVMQAVTGNLIIAIGIAISVTMGKENIFTRPEYSGPMSNNQWRHAGGHLFVDGLIVGPLLGWVIASILMFATQRLSRPKAVSASATD